MKTAIKLALIYLAMQILGALAVGPFTMIYAYVKYGTVDRASEFALAPTLLAGFVFMLIYLWQKGYLTGDKRLYSPVSVSYLSWSAMMGISMIYLIDFLMSHLTFLPDWLSDTFDLLQSGWLGIICVAILGPILEELLFRGAITKVLLKKYNPLVAILISGLIFGIFHMNPAQVVGATLILIYISIIFLIEAQQLKTYILRVFLQELIERTSDTHIIVTVIRVEITHTFFTRAVSSEIYDFEQYFTRFGG